MRSWSMCSKICGTGPPTICARSERRSWRRSRLFLEFLSQRSAVALVRTGPRSGHSPSPESVAGRQFVHLELFLRNRLLGTPLSASKNSWHLILGTSTTRSAIGCWIFFFFAPRTPVHEDRSRNRDAPFSSQTYYSDYTTGVTVTSERHTPTGVDEACLHFRASVTRAPADDYATPNVTAKKMANSRQSTKALTVSSGMSQIMQGSSADG